MVTRIKDNIQNIGVLITIIVTFVGLVAWASTVANTVAEVNIKLEKQEAKVESISQELTSYKLDTALMNQKLDYISEIVTELKKNRRR
jgi:uncharacterized coiled-coil protein SlyX